MDSFAGREISVYKKRRKEVTKLRKVKTVVVSKLPNHYSYRTVCQHCVGQERGP